MARQQQGISGESGAGDAGAGPVFVDDTKDCEAREQEYRQRGTARPITVVGNPVLHRECKDVTSFDAELASLVDDMFASQRAAEGVGLAANQIGVPLQVAIIEIEDRITELVNPQVVKSSGEQLDWEGCLSIPGYVAEVQRAAKVTVKARDRHGKEFRVKGEELMARALQHEIDHLNGLLYVDYLESLDELVRVSEAADEVTEEAAAGI